MITGAKYPFELPQLPYSKKSLEPFISEQTISFHHEKHHQAYVNNLNNLLKDEQFKHIQSMDLEQIIRSTSRVLSETSVFNNAAQIWNHDFYWHCMSPNGGGIPKGILLDKIEKDFGSYEQFKLEFSKAALSQFGSGWAWLVWSKDQERMLITKTGNADLPMIHDQVALMTIDVWEHAYYIDYQNRRADYVNVFIEKLMNWGYAESRLASC